MKLLSKFQNLPERKSKSFLRSIIWAIIKIDKKLILFPMIINTQPINLSVPPGTINNLLSRIHPSNSL